MNTDQQARILQYLKGELDTSSQEAFEKDCQNDPELMETLKLELQTRFVLRETARKYFDTPRDLAENSQRPANSFLFYRIAAGIAIVLVLGIALYFLLNKQPSPQELYAMNYSVPAISQVRDANIQGDSLWSLGVQAYQQKQWSEAESYITQYLNLDKPSAFPQARLLLGITLLEQTDMLAALSTFSEIANTNHPYFYDARWYSALIHIRNEDVEKAQPELNTLLQSKVYRERARKILKQLQDL